MRPAHATQPPAGRGQPPLSPFAEGGGTEISPFSKGGLRGIPVFLPLVLLLLACASPSAGPVSVLRVIDGDTIVIAGDARVRYIGMDTPEVGERCGAEATRLNGDLVGGKRVRLEKDVSETDRFGRLLRYVWANDTLVNAEMVRRGYARAIAYPPDTRRQGLLAQLESEARAARRGMWASGPCPAP